MGLLLRLLRWLWLRYLDWLVCLHFCAFRRAGSAMKYTHVHVLGDNPQNATGLGHDDETNVGDPGHASVSIGGECTTQAENDASMALRQAPYLATAYFHPCPDAQDEPPGFRRIRCRCGDEDIWVCYTLDHDVFWAWYQEQKWDNRLGTYAYPETAAALIAEGHALGCPDTLVLVQHEVERVPDCTGFGPTDADNALIRQARVELQTAVDRISCASGCQKRVTENFRGWMCVPTVFPDIWHARAVVQWRVECAP